MILRKEKILVIEDFASVRSILCDILSKKGYQVLEAPDGTVALDMLKKEQVDLVISDYNMPRTDGMGLLMQIRKDEIMNKLPVIFVTSEQDTEKRKAAQRAGLTDWISKPYKYFRLMNSVESALSRKWLNASAAAANQWGEVGSERIDKRGT